MKYDLANNGIEWKNLKQEQPKKGKKYFFFVCKRGESYSDCGFLDEDEYGLFIDNSIGRMYLNGREEVFFLPVPYHLNQFA